MLNSNDVNAPMYGLFRRETLEQIGGHHIHGSDRLIVAHAALLGPFAFVDETLFQYRIHPNSTLFLDRKTWAERETGRAGSVSVLSPLYTFYRYAGAVANADLTVTQRARAWAATSTLCLRPDVLRKAFLPGPDNYWGWRLDSKASHVSATPRI